MNGRWLSGIEKISGQTTLSNAGDNAVLMGKNAARRYEVSNAGESVTIAGKNWSVAGIFEEGSPAKLDTIDNIIMMPLASAQKAFGLEGWISAMLLTAKPGQSETLASSLAVTFPSLKVNTQADIRVALLKEMDMPGRFLGRISWTAFVIAMLIIANIMIVAIRERAQEVEPIRAIGRRGPIIVSSSLVAALLLGLTGGATGTLLSVPLAYMVGWSWILTWQELLRVFGISLVAALVAGLYPAYRASRIYPKAL